jgi:hypothetical protein
MSFFHSPRIVTDGLVLYLDAANSKSYPGSGTDWTNIADTSMTGSIISATYSTNNLGNFNFDETNDYVVISSGSESLNIGTNHTWVWWLRIPDFTGDLYQYIYSHNTFASTNACNIWFTEDAVVDVGFGGPELLKFEYNDTSTADVRARFNNTLSIADNQWHMITLVKSGWSHTDNTLYVDSDKFTSLTNEITEQSITKCVPTGDLNVGRRADANSQRYFGGDMAILMVYKDKALTEQEVLQNYNALRGRFGI